MQMKQFNLKSNFGIVLLSVSSVLGVFLGISLLLDFINGIAAIPYFIGLFPLLIFSLGWYLTEKTDAFNRVFCRGILGLGYLSILVYLVQSENQFLFFRLGLALLFFGILHSIAQYSLKYSSRFKTTLNALSFVVGIGLIGFAIIESKTAVYLNIIAGLLILFSVLSLLSIFSKNKTV
jgi:uncharacterized membrane protein HdeD (DUF308 family)